MTWRAGTVSGRSEGGRAIRDHDRGHDSDAAKVQLSSGPRSLVQAKALPNSNDPTGCVAKAATLARGAWGVILGHLAFGSRVGPCGSCPHTERGQSVAALRSVIATHWRRLGYWREQAGGSGERAETQRDVSRGGGTQPNTRREVSTSNKIQS